MPMQPDCAATYEPDEALNRGTLFPGLDLPFLNMINESNPYAGTPLGELMAIDFAIKELNLYLDTHRDDAEAFDMLTSLIALSEAGHEKYVRLYGPLQVTDLKKAASFTWLESPWPWEYCERTGGK